MARRRRRRHYFPHIYFESKKPGKDSVYEAVPDIGRPGVRTSKEVKLLVAATLADLADGKTVDHRGRVKRFTSKTLRGRFLVLAKLSKKYGGKSAVEKGKEIASKAIRIRDLRKRKQYLKKALQELGISKEMIEQLIARTNPGRK